MNLALSTNCLKCLPKRCLIMKEGKGDTCTLLLQKVPGKSTDWSGLFGVNLHASYLLFLWFLAVVTLAPHLCQIYALIYARSFMDFPISHSSENEWHSRNLIHWGFFIFRCEFMILISLSEAIKSNRNVQKSQCMWKVHIISTFFSESAETP